MTAAQVFSHLDIELIKSGQRQRGWKWFYHRFVLAQYQGQPEKGPAARETSEKVNLNIFKLLRPLKSFQLWSGGGGGWAFMRKCTGDHALAFVFWWRRRWLSWAGCSCRPQIILFAILKFKVLSQVQLTSGLGRTLKHERQMKAAEMAIMQVGRSSKQMVLHSAMLTA